MSSAESGYERSDLPPKGVTLAFAGLFFGVGVSSLVVGLMFVAFQHRLTRPPTTAIENTRLVPPAPRLETTRAGDRAAVEAEAERLLHSYAWTDRAAGQARIPIERAMAITAERGWRDPPAATPHPEPSR